MTALTSVGNCSSERRHSHVAEVHPKAWILWLLLQFSRRALSCICCCCLSFLCARLQSTRAARFGGSPCSRTQQTAAAAGAVTAAANIMGKNVELFRSYVKLTGRMGLFAVCWCCRALGPTQHRGCCTICCCSCCNVSWPLRAQRAASSSSSSRRGRPLQRGSKECHRVYCLGGSGREEKTVKALHERRCQ